MFIDQAARWSRGSPPKRPKSVSNVTNRDPLDTANAAR
jgi:hypothetical protein